jgi:hypothetical protein
MSSPQTLSLEYSIQPSTLQGKEKDSSLMVQGDSFTFKASWRRAPTQENLTRWKGVWDCLAGWTWDWWETKACPFRTKECHVILCQQASWGKREKVAKKVFRGQRKCRQVGILFSAKLPSCDRHTGTPPGISAHHFTELFQKHIFYRCSHLFANLRELSKDLTCMPLVRFYYAS